MITLRKKKNKETEERMNMNIDRRNKTERNTARKNEEKVGVKSRKKGRN